MSRSFALFLITLLLSLGGRVGSWSEDVSAAWMLGPFTRPEGVNPIITANPASVFDDPMSQHPDHWEALHTFNPAAVVRDGKVWMLYRAEDDSGTMAIGRHTSRLGLAISDDGLHFTRRPTPVLYPDEDDQKANEWTGGCEDPRLVEAEDGSYVLTYTQYNHKIPRLAVATSPDLVHWTKHGPAFARALDGRYAGLVSKSAGIVTRLQQGRLKAVKIAGKYWMYWGEGSVRLATSDNLLDWTMVEAAPGKPMIVLPPRPGKFDGPLTEQGPPPILTSHGIVVLYNGKNGGGLESQGLEKGAYADGEALFEASDPTKLLARTGKPFYLPEENFEKSGQYAAGTTFIEGLVYFHARWFLYYGCADSRVAVAVGLPGPP